MYQVLNWDDGSGAVPSASPLANRWTSGAGSFALGESSVWHHGTAAAASFRTTTLFFCCLRSPTDTRHRFFSLVFLLLRLLLWAPHAALGLPNAHATARLDAAAVGLALFFDSKENGNNNNNNKSNNPARIWMKSISRPSTWTWAEPIVARRK